jgi:nucleoside-diphosphate-sugar epimerase
MRAMPQTKTAVVVGALGVIGRYIVDRLASLPDWQVVGLSRRQGEDRERVRYLSVDLTDAKDAAAKLSGLGEATQVFYCAFQASGAQAADYAKGTAVNLAMLENSVRTVDAVAKNLERVVLITGTKYYGSHLGPFKTPAREDDPRHMPPDFYFDQIDWLTDFQRGKQWSWTELRPQTLCGFAPGTPMSIVPVIAVYAAISKALGLPLRFPGKPGAYRAIYQVTESTHIARAALWAALDARCANQAYNITNGDYFRWINLWPKIAEVFEMPVAEPQTISLVAHMADKGPLWERLVNAHGLQPYRYEEIVAWPFGDYVFGCDWDVMTSTTKARQHGFHDVVDSEEMFLRLLTQFRRERIVP